MPSWFGRGIRCAIRGTRRSGTADTALTSWSRAWQALVRTALRLVRGDLVATADRAPERLNSRPS